MRPAFLPFALGYLAWRSPGSGLVRFVARQDREFPVLVTFPSLIWAGLLAFGKMEHMDWWFAVGTLMVVIGAGAVMHRLVNRGKETTLCRRLPSEVKLQGPLSRWMGQPVWWFEERLLRQLSDIAKVEALQRQQQQSALEKAVPQVERGKRRL